MLFPLPPALHAAKEAYQYSFTNMNSLWRIPKDAFPCYQRAESSEEIRQ